MKGINSDVITMIVGIIVSKLMKKILGGRKDGTVR
mgnify:CR=1 FL=1